MPVRLFVLFSAVLSALLLTCSFPVCSAADPAEDLATAETSEAQASTQVSAAESEVGSAEQALEPIEKKASTADEAAEEAEANVETVRSELIEERTQAADEIESATADYEDEQSAHDTTTAIGLGIAGLALLIAVGAFVFSKLRKWPLSKRLTQLGASGLGVLFLAGLGLAFIPASPSAPEFTDETEALAAQAKGDPADPPTQELTAAEETAEPLVKKAESLDKNRDDAAGVVADAESQLEDAQSSLRGARQDVRFAANVVEREEREAAKEAAFREEATTIDYDQLIKNPYRYVGEKVVYTGQIFQIQEGFESFMLLSVTDEGYGFWTDEIWVSGFGEIESAEEDVVTVYGTVTGAEEYETSIGGSNYVPKIKAKYIDE
ncbi:MAG TPA: hypothetical protein VG944_12240 [Fimbriimonas sp.]|nr:hypothetical protein [Fimbriimonas sp.]